MSVIRSDAISAKFSRRLANNPHIYQWLNGIAVIPTWHALHQLDVLPLLRIGDGGERLSFRNILKCVQEKHPTMRAGSLLGAFRTLAFQGWLSIEDRGLDTRLELTREGAMALALLDRTATTISIAIAEIAWLSRLPDIVGNADDSGVANCTAAIRNLAELSAAGWELLPTPDGDQDAVSVQIARYVDALILCPVLVLFARSGLLGELSAFEMIEGRPGADWPLQSYAEPLGSLLTAMLEFLQDQGVVTSDDEGWSLTGEGKSLASEAANFGVVTSYLNTFAHFRDYLAGASDVLDVDLDEHVDRALNIWGSSGSTTAKAIRQNICECILTTLFDELPLDEQPLGIADMGCGDGRALAEFAEFVIEGTQRGKNLASHPLHLVGADISPISRAAASRNLKRFAGRKGVVTAVIEGDVSDPSAFDLALRSLRWDEGRASASSFLHTQLFLLHDRRRLIDDCEQASEELNIAISRTSAFAIEDAISSVGKDIPPPPWSESESGKVGAEIANAFTTSCCDRGELVPAVVVGADLVALLERWRSYAPFGIVIVEPHVPRLDEINGSNRDRTQVDPAPAVWGVHFPSNQFLMPFVEFELALSLAGFSTVERWNSATGGLSMTWSVSSELVYQTVAMPSALALEHGL